MGGWGEGRCAAGCGALGAMCGEWCGAVQHAVHTIVCCVVYSVMRFALARSGVAGYRGKFGTGWTVLSSHERFMDKGFSVPRLSGPHQNDAHFVKTYIACMGLFNKFQDQRASPRTAAHAHQRQICCARCPNSHPLWHSTCGSRHIPTSQCHT